MLFVLVIKLPPCFQLFHINVVLKGFETHVKCVWTCSCFHNVAPLLNVKYKDSIWFHNLATAVKWWHQQKLAMVEIFNQIICSVGSQTEVLRKPPEDEPIWLRPITCLTTEPLCSIQPKEEKFQTVNARVYLENVQNYKVFVFLILQRWGTPSNSRVQWTCHWIQRFTFTVFLDNHIVFLWRCVSLTTTENRNYKVWTKWLRAALWAASTIIKLITSQLFPHKKKKKISSKADMCRLTLFTF